ncbi:AI-2E family transporter [Pseudoruegeria aquimaris]|nr:AI-2E family transporter [Pseudoruegeria aquimaris]
MSAKMTEDDRSPEAVRAHFPQTVNALRWLTLIVITLLITAGFLNMVRPFLIALVMAAISAALAAPLFERTNALLKGRRMLASTVTMLIVAVIILLPLLGIIAMASQQAAGVASSVVRLLNEVAADPQAVTLPDWLPGWVIAPDTMNEILPRLRDAAASIASAVTGFLVSSISAVTRSTASFVLSGFIYLYAMFFFLQMKTPIARVLLAYTGLRPDVQALLWERVVSVSRATVKGTLLIGVVQGALGGLGFWVAGIEGAAFWAVVMAVFSVVPGIGPTLIIFFGVIYLLATGATGAAVGLGIWGAGVVGTVDNLLRPALVGRDAKMHDILILVSTLGGLVTFGAVGLVLGPVLAGLFVAIWTTLAEVVGYEEAASESEPAAASDQG